jgi:outer membrane protein OmpA-like peptidoglycan-associated protein
MKLSNWMEINRFWSWVMAGALLIPVASGAAVPPFGYEIQSRSTSEYFLRGNLEIVQSATVSTSVGAYHRVALTPLGSVTGPAFSLDGFGGDSLYCRFDVRNIGNVADSVEVTSSIIPPSTVALGSVVFFNDSNSDFEFDPGEDDRSFLNLLPGYGAHLNTLVVLPSRGGGGESYLAVRAAVGAALGRYEEESVLFARTRADPVTSLHIGPLDNPRALPGGEGSPDDVSRAGAGLDTRSIVFENVILNDGQQSDFVQIEPADSSGWPPEFDVAVEDSGGNLLRASPGNSNAVMLGELQADETRTIRVRVTPRGASFYHVIVDSLAIRLRARSLVDLDRMNDTEDRVLLDEPFNPDAAVTLEQTFKENEAGFGDIVTLVVAVTNVTDSVRVEDTVVHQTVQPALDFLSSTVFEADGADIVWRVGPLGPGERRESAVKFSVNSRVSSGWTKVIGDARGSAFGREVHAGPIVNALRIGNDVFADEGVVLGDVFVDGDNDGKRDEDEEGLPRVGVFLESGEYALTDSTGRFTIPRAFSGYRVVRIDEATLSAERVDTSALATRTNAARGTERLVHLLPSGHAVVSFPLPRAADRPEKRISRQISCGASVSLRRREDALYQLPALPASLFGAGQAFIRTDKLPDLNPIVEYLRKNPGWMVFLEGHTDSIPIHTPSFASNLELSLARAEAVMRYLEARGVAPERIVAKGSGDTRPVASNATRDGRSANRRVEVTLVPPGTSVDDESARRRVVADAREIQSEPESLFVRCVWELSTDAPEPLELHLSFDVPGAFHNAVATVTCGGSEIPGDGRSFHASGFAKSRGIECELNFSACTADTSLLRAVRLTVIPPAGLPAGSVSERSGRANPAPDSRVVLEPFHGDTGAADPAYAPIVTWTEDPERESQTAAPTQAPTDTAAAKAFGIIEPVDKSVVSKRDEIEVKARLPLGSRYTLRCNGAAVHEKQIGRKEIHLEDRYEEITWWGVKIGEGWNIVSVSAAPPDRTPELLDSVTVALTGRPAAIELSPRRVVIPADGRSKATIRVSLRDNLGFPSVNGLTATIVEGDSLVENPDENPEQSGLQIASRDGEFLVQVRPSSVPGRGRIGVESHALSASCPVGYVPPDRPMFVSGIVEGRIGAFDASGDGDPTGLDEFDDGLDLDGESRVFAQGTTYGGVNVTARVDTKKRNDDPLLKTDNPETQYPTYGDASELEYAAPAQGGNYVALEKGQSFVRYGDFRSPLTEGEFLAYKRSSTGLEGAFASGADGVGAFITKTDFFTVRDEIPGDGTSGYYYLSRTPVVENSVNLVLEIRGRYRPEDILERTPLVEHRDFTVNYFNGAVLFKEPVAAFTPELNPVTIVAIYEAESTAEGDYVYGLRGDLAESRRFKVGASAIATDGDQSSYALYGADGSLALGRLDLSGEFARSEDDVAGNGSAYKLQLGAKKVAGEHSVYLRKVDGDFLNPSFTGSAHELFSEKAGFDSHLILSPRFSVDSHGHRHRFENTGDEKDNVDVFGHYDGPVLTLGAGARTARQVQDGKERSGVLSIAGAGIKAGGRAEFQTRWEANLGAESVDDYPDRLRSALSYSFLERYKAVASHEYLSARGRPATHQLLAGVDARAGRNSTVYTKYAMTRTANDERLGSILGLRQAIPINPHFSGSFDIEGFRSFSDQTEDEYVALKTGLSRLIEGESLVEGRYEYRWQRAGDRHLLQINAAKEFENGVAVLFKDALSLGETGAGKSSLRMDGRLGGVYRPVVTPVRTMLLLKTEYDRYSPVDPQAITWTTVLSTDVNFFPDPAHELRVKLAVKRVEDFSLGISGTVRNYLTLAQYVYHFAPAWDVDIWGRVVGAAEAGTRQTGAGIELGRVFFDRLRVAAGYSVNGFEDRDMAESDAWVNGFGVRVQLILSDWMFNGYRF